MRIEYPRATHHVMNRGDHREDIFLDDEDRQRFLATPGAACQKTEWPLLRPGAGPPALRSALSGRELFDQRDVSGKLVGSCGSGFGLLLGDYSAHSALGGAHGAKSKTLRFIKEFYGSVLPPA